MANMDLVALKAFDHHGRPITAGEAFSTYRKEAKRLIVSGEAKAAAETETAAAVPAAAPAVPATPAAPAATLVSAVTTITGQPIASGAKT